MSKLIFTVFALFFGTNIYMLTTDFINGEILGGILHILNAVSWLLCAALFKETE